MKLNTIVKHDSIKAFTKDLTPIRDAKNITNVCSLTGEDEDNNLYSEMICKKGVYKGGITVYLTEQKHITRGLVTTELEYEVVGYDDLHDLLRLTTKL